MIKISIIDWLVVWNMNFMFHHIWDVIPPIDELIFFRGVGIPPTRLSMLIGNKRKISTLGPLKNLN
jgi:hypothetical protein